MSVIALSSDNFTATVSENDLVVVDFWATWCEPCKNFSKVVEEVALKYPNVLFAGVDIEAEKELAEDFNILSVPALLIIRQQVVVFAESGLMPAGALCELIDSALALTDSELDVN